MGSSAPLLLFLLVNLDLPKMVHAVTSQRGIQFLLVRSTSTIVIFQNVQTVIDWLLQSFVHLIVYMTSPYRRSFPAAYLGWMFLQESLEMPSTISARVNLSEKMNVLLQSCFLLLIGLFRVSGQNGVQKVPC